MKGISLPVHLLETLSQIAGEAKEVRKHRVEVPSLYFNGHFGVEVSAAAVHFLHSF